MNERIQELLHQCSVPNDQAENYSKSKGLVIPDQKLDVAKFAELIVKEVLDEVLQAMDDGMDVYDTVADKFGVEE